MRLLMLTITTAILTFGVPTPCDPQESAIGTSPHDFGGFIGLNMRFGDMAGDFGAFAGGEAAILLKRRVYLGIRGSGLATDNNLVPGAGGSPDEILRAGYGGLLIGFVIPTRSFVDVSVDALIGAGAIGTGEEGADSEYDAVFVFEPSVMLDLRLARIAQLGIGAGYRFFGDADVPGVDDADLRGFTGVARVRVGWF